MNEPATRFLPRDIQIRANALQILAHAFKQKRRFWVNARTGGQISKPIMQASISLPRLYDGGIWPKIPRNLPRAEAIPWVPHPCCIADQWRVVLLRTLRQQVNLRQNPHPHLDTALPLSWKKPRTDKAANPAATAPTRSHHYNVSYPRDCWGTLLCLKTSRDIGSPAAVCDCQTSCSTCPMRWRLGDMSETATVMQASRNARAGTSNRAIPPIVAC